MSFCFDEVHQAVMRAHAFTHTFIVRNIFILCISLFISVQNDNDWIKAYYKKKLNGIKEFSMGQFGV